MYYSMNYKDGLSYVREYINSGYTFKAAIKSLRELRDYGFISTEDYHRVTTYYLCMC